MNAVAWDNHVRCFDAAKGGTAQHWKNDCRCKDQEGARPSSAWAGKFLDPAHSCRFRVLANRIGTAIAEKCMVPSSGALRAAKDSASSG